MANEKTYNGWSNYETWLVKLWIDNEEGSYRYWTAEARGQTDAYRFGKEIEAYHEEIAEEGLKSQNGFLADLVNAGLSEVNWNEIAQSLIDDNEEETD